MKGHTRSNNTIKAGGSTKRAQNVDGVGEWMDGLDTP